MELWRGQSCLRVLDTQATITPQTRLSASRPLDMTGSENYIPALESTGSDLYRDSDRAV